ncbi:unnamed protein product [Owenia fusiformis]|uniref:Uncharacterized protein n=1 Tax=Owenia fusiformis TaxID=6347 RepID=A0A8J1TWU5_OWEFU|nr:unnamed protein product [Owenia fusiformis]
MFTYEMCILDKDCRKLLFECSACVSFGAAFVLIVLVVGFAPPYLHGNGFKQTICVVIETGYHDDIPCKCGRWSVMTPVRCLQVLVSYRQQDGEIVRNVTIHREYTARGCTVKESNCSYGVCSEDPVSDIHTLQTFKYYYGLQGRVYDCFYDPTTHNSHAYIERPRPATVIHMIAWPTGFLLMSLSVCAVMVISYIRTRWRLCCFPNNDEDSRIVHLSNEFR